MEKLLRQEQVKRSGTQDEASLVLFQDNAD